ncbi:MAG TPA: hypothetical protein DF712_14555, partial [Balneola sp.]|nr:hypothetical protein [Balneola sp.]
MKKIHETHKEDLQKAIYYLPHNFDLDVLCKCLKHVYGEQGIYMAIEWGKKAKVLLPKDFQEYWKKQTLTSYYVSIFDDYLSEEIYTIAKENRWIPKEFENGKNKSKPPSKRRLKDQSIQKDYKKDVQADIRRAFEKELPEHKKSFVRRGVINLEGACYVHPAMSKIELDSLNGNSLHKLEKIVDCEITIVEAIEHLIRQPGQAEDDKEVSYRIRFDNKLDNEVLTKATYEELTTKTRFSSFLVSKGFVKFLGTTSQFDLFHEFIINGQDYPTVRVLSSWGEYKPGKFIFKNGLYDVKEKKFYPSDENQRIRYQNRILICPDGNELVQPPELSVPTDAITSVAFLAEKFNLWESINGRFNVRSTLGYAIASLYNRRILESDSAFPLLFKFGERGTGKSSSMDWFMTLFGYKSGNRQSVSKQNTLKGMIRNMTLPIGFPFFLDDYRNHETNNQVPDLTSSILNWYHQIGSSMAKKSTDHQTIDTPM